VSGRSSGRSSRPFVGRSSAQGSRSTATDRKRPEIRFVTPLEYQRSPM
jgi:hypothetical protein